MCVMNGKANSAGLIFALVHDFKIIIESGEVSMSEVDGSLN